MALNPADIQRPPDSTNVRSVAILGAPLPVLASLEHSFAAAGIATRRGPADTSWYLVLLRIPDEVKRNAATHCAALAEQLREVFATLTRPAEIVVLLDVGHRSDASRIRAKLAATLNRTGAEGQILFGVASTINAIDISEHVDCELLCRRLIQYFDQSETLATGELLFAADLLTHSIGALLADRYA